MFDHDVGDEFLSIVKGTKHEEVWWLLQLNKRGRQLLHNVNNVPNSLWPFVLERMTQSSSKTITAKSTTPSSKTITTTSTIGW